MVVPLIKDGHCAPPTNGSLSRLPIKITGIGSCLPDRVLTNEYFENQKILSTTSKWIMRRTGIKERRIAKPDEYTSDLALRAAQRAMDMAGITPKDIDLILAATVTPDNIFPTLACWIQKRLECNDVGAVDLSAACSGFVYCLGMARNMMTMDGYQNVLVVGAETLSRITDYEDRETCIIFADGSGAAILQPCEDESSWMGPAFLCAQGRPDLLIVPGGGSRQPATVESVTRHDHFMKMSGRELFKFVVQRCVEMIEFELKRHQLSIDDIKYIIPHQANQRIMDTIADRFSIPREKVFSNIEFVGNTSSASIPIALDQLHREGKIERGDLLMLCAFGGGITWASSVVKW